MPHKKEGNTTRNHPIQKSIKRTKWKTQTTRSREHTNEWSGATAVLKTGLLPHYHHYHYHHWHYRRHYHYRHLRHVRHTSQRPWRVQSLPQAKVTTPLTGSVSDEFRGLWSRNFWSFHSLLEERALDNWPYGGSRGPQRFQDLSREAIRSCAVEMHCPM